VRFMIEFSVPTPQGNDVVRSGKIERVFRKLGEDLKPEAMYFYPDAGVRAGCMFIQTDNPSLCVSIGERLWFGLQAHVKVTPVMNAEELGKGLAELPKIIENYA